MKKIISSAYFRALLSGSLSALAIIYIESLSSLIWVALIPLFGVLFSATPKKSIKLGVIYGVILSLFLSAWMIVEVRHYSAGSLIYPILAFVTATLFFGLFYAFTFGIFAFVKSRRNSKLAVYCNMVLLAAICCFTEGLINQSLRGFPWLNLHFGLALISDLYAIQTASVVGVYGLSFMVVIINALLSFTLKKKKLTLALVPSSLLVVFYLFGYLNNKTLRDKAPTTKPIRIAILADNIAPDTKWNEKSGNALIARLREMNIRAIRLKPDFNLWSETVVPWTYESKDPFVNLIVSESKLSEVNQLLGMSTPTSVSNTVYNSAYFLAPDGSIVDRYDKQELLNLIEQPFAGILIAFSSNLGFTALPGPKKQPLATPYEKIGILLCNESASSCQALNAVKNGATYFCNMSNDGWNKDSYLATMHFYQARLRAVETRKDMAITSNNGYSGLIKSSGDILLKIKSQDPIVQLVEVHPRKTLSIYSQYPRFWFYSSLALILSCIIISSFSNRGQIA